MGLKVTAELEIKKGSTDDDLFVSVRLLREIADHLLNLVKIVPTENSVTLVYELDEDS